MPKSIQRKKTTGRRANGASGTEANFPLFNGAVAGYEKWARETLVGKTGPFAYESPERFAEGIIRYVEKIRFYLAKGAVDHAVTFSFRFGDFVHWMKAEVIGNGAERRKNILFGINARVANLIRRKKQEAKAAPKTAALHERIKARAAELRVESKRGKARILALEFPLSAYRIERII